MSSEEAEAICRLFAQEIPELAAGTVEIKAVARRTGLRTKVAVRSTDNKTDCIGACVGVRGIRIRRIVEQANGERIDLVRWSESVEEFMCNALQPAKIEHVRVDHSQRRATVFVREDQESLAVGRRGLNEQLASELCGYAINVRSF